MILSRLSSSSIFAALPLLAACTGPIVLADGNGGSTTTSSSSSTHTTTTTSTGTGGQPPGNACTEAGGTCELTGETCAGTVGQAGSCGAAVGAFCCLPSTCSDPCPVEMLGQTRCAGAGIQTCKLVGNCSGWVATTPCPSGESCNSTGTKCVAPATQCSSPADCGCFCTCTPQGTCGDCTGAIPPSCTQNSDCGPTCAGYRCVGGTCQM